MNAKEHLTVGLIVSTIVSALLFFFTDMDLGLVNLIIYPIVAVLFCLLPDIDHKSGTATWVALGAGILLIILGILSISILVIGIGKIMVFYGIIILVFTFCAAEFIGHRQFIHSITFGLIAAGSLYFIFHSWQLCIVAFISFWSHLCADGLWFKLI